MIGLANFVDEHRGAIERDLLVETGHELRDIGRTLSWGALSSFLSSVHLDSALAEELNPDMARWATRVKTNEILADIYDMLAVINANLHVHITHKPGKKPKPYKRPGDQDKQHIGKDAIPLSKMREWIESRRKR